MLREVEGLSVEETAELLPRRSRPGFYGRGGGCKRLWHLPCLTPCVTPFLSQVKRVRRLQSVC